MNRSKAATRVLVLVAALAAGLGVMSPAHAATTRDGCTVDPQTPYHNGTFTAGGARSDRSTSDPNPRLAFR
jgi:hypothetical protein